jgi:hypothetical protein
MRKGGAGLHNVLRQQTLWLPLAVLAACASVAEQRNPSPRPVAITSPTDNRCLRVEFQPARTNLHIRERLAGKFVLTALCSGLRLYPSSTFSRDLFLTAWNDATRLKVKPLVPPYPAAPGPPAALDQYVRLEKGASHSFYVSEPADTLFSGPGRYTLVADYIPRLTKQLVPSTDIITSEDGPFNRSKVTITVIE